MNIILFAGSRKIQYPENVKETIETFLTQNHDIGNRYIHGGAKGVDTIADEIIRSHGLTPTVYRPDYERFGRSAPLIRDIQMVDEADLIYIYWNGVSHGTAFVIAYAKLRNKPIYIEEEH